MNPAIAPKIKAEHKKLIRKLLAFFHSSLESAKFITLSASKFCGFLEGSLELLVS